MKIYLSEIPADKVIGIYGDNEGLRKEAKRARKMGDYKAERSLLLSLKPGGMPKRARAMHPLAAADYIRMMDTEPPERQPVVSDMLRSPETSLHISQIPGRSALPPAYSGHNFGESIDSDHTTMRKRAGFHSKKELDALFAKYNFFNFWQDDEEEHDIEDWHNNHTPAEFRDKDGGFSSKTSVAYLEQMTLKRYGAQMVLTVRECQAALNTLGFDVGKVDGDVGTLTRRGLEAFQHRWIPRHTTGEFDARTQRTLAFLTAEIVWVPPGTVV